MPVLFGGHNLPPLVEIGLTDLPKSGSARDDRSVSTASNPGYENLSTTLHLKFCGMLNLMLLFTSCKNASVEMKVRMLLQKLFQPMLDL